MISIAILPFKNLSSNLEHEYFCDGMTEEIINALDKIEQLKVTSRTSCFYFKNNSATLQEIANKLDVEIVLEGSAQIVQDQVRIRTQLIDISNDLPFWSESWDRKMDDIFKVQDDISLLVADKLREQIGHLELSDHLVESPTQNKEAYDNLLKARYHIVKWNPEDTELAIQYYEKAVKADPQLIEGHLGLADSYSFMAVAGFAPREEAWDKANQSIETAKTIDPENAKLNYMLGHQAFFTLGDFGAAMRYGLKAIANKPTYSEAHNLLSFLYSLNGDFQQCQKHVHFSKSVDPLNPEALFFEANYYNRSGQIKKAIPILDELLRDNPKNLPAIIVSAQIKIQKHLGAETIAFIEGFPEELMPANERTGVLCLAHLVDGGDGQPYLSELEQQSEAPSSHHAHSYLFIIYAYLERNDDAFKVLDYLFQHQSSILLLGFSDPIARNIKKDVRYADYHKKLYPKVTVKESSKPKTDAEVDPSTIQEMKNLVLHFIETESPYLNPSLTLRLLANEVNIHPNKLSWLLNEHLGKNFNEFINQYRIEHFKKLITDPSNNHISIIGLAYESGFNSKTVFNTSFKKEVGMTPKQYQKSQS